MRSDVRGFVLRELLAACVIMATLLGVLAVLADAGRRASGAHESLNNLRTLHGAYMTVSADRADEFPTFTWRAGENQTEFDDLRYSESNLNAASNQAIDILRRRADRNFLKLSGWIPHILYNHLVLADALDWRLPTEFMIPPDDAVRQCWIRHMPFGEGCEIQLESYQRSLPYSSPYSQGLAFFSSPDSGPDSILQTGNCCYSVPDDVVFGGRRVGEVAFPSDKAYLFDIFMRGDRPLYFMFEEARVPVARVDGSAAFETTSRSNLGWNPRDPAGEPLQLRYFPHHPNDPRLPQGFNNRVIAHYGSTRGALAGRDFDGPEAPLP